MRAAKEGRLDIVDRTAAHLGVDLAVTNADGCNALWLACYNGSHAIIERLIAAGIDIDRQNGNGATCLMYVVVEQQARSGQAAAGTGRQPAARGTTTTSPPSIWPASLPCLKLLRKASRAEGAVGKRGVQ
jgi:ankyrin repeat protein